MAEQTDPRFSTLSETESSRSEGGPPGSAFARGGRRSDDSGTGNESLDSFPVPESAPASHRPLGRATPHFAMFDALTGAVSARTHNAEEKHATGGASMGMSRTRSDLQGGPDASLLAPIRSAVRRAPCLEESCRLPLRIANPSTYSLSTARYAVCGWPASVILARAALRPSCKKPTLFADSLEEFCLEEEGNDVLEIRP